MIDAPETGGASKVFRSRKEDRRPNTQKIGALFSAEINFSVPASGVGAVPADLFGQIAAEKPAITASCARCGVEFQQPIRRNRRLSFCSDECRTGQKSDQMRRWRASAPAAAAIFITCRQCGQEFEPPPRTKGRAPHWCSPACRRDGFAGRAYEPPKADLFTAKPTERNTP